MANVAAIILAAGGSSRFGRAKQLIQFRGRSLIQNAINAAVGADCRPVVVVTGSESARIRAAIAGSGISIVENSEWREGIASSILAGIRHVLEHWPQTSAAVLMACDQPFVTDSVLRGLIDRWCKTGKPIAASSYSDTLGVPALFDRSCFDELLQLKGDSGAKPIIFKDRENVSEVTFLEGAVDIDTIDDWRAIDQSQEDK